MLTCSRKLIYDSVSVLFLLLVIAGCAQTKANIKEDASQANNGAVVLQSVDVAGDASQVVITADKPLSYTFYKENEPPKVVVDLSDTDPGAVQKLIEVNKGAIKQIEVAKHDFAGGFLSRVIVTLAKNEDVSVQADAADKRKLVLSLAPSSNQETQANSEIKEETIPDANAGNADKNGAPQVLPEKTSAEETKTADAAGALAKPVTSVSQKDAVAVSAPGPKVLSAVVAGDNAIEIKVNGGIDTFKTFKLAKPDRLVIDLAGIKNRITAKSVAIGKFGIGNARLGVYPDKVRIVFDSARGTLPTYQVQKVSDGLKVVFPGNNPQSTQESAKDQAKQTPEAKQQGASPKSAVESIGFKVVDGFSQIVIKVGGACSVGNPVKVAGGLSLTIENCQIPNSLQRMIDTSAYASIVQRITPYQVRVKNRSDTRIRVNLRDAAPSALKQEGDTVYWNIKNPENLAHLQHSGASSARTDAIGGSMGKPLAVATLANDKKIYTGRRVSLEFSDADIRKILQLIAEVSNLNFVLGDDVTGTISIKLVNVPWDQALDVILETKGLEKRQEGNIMYIRPKGKFKTQEQEEAELQKEREMRMVLKTKVFELNYASITDIAAQFDKLRSDRGTISQDPRTNRVIVTDVEERLQKMAALLKELDIPEKQVMIEARIVEASDTFSRDLGIQWGVHATDADAKVLGISSVDAGFGGVVDAVPPTSGTFGPGSAVGVTFGTLNSNVQVDMRLAAAATIGQVKIISTPKILTLNNKAAKISQGQSIPYQTTSAEGTQTQFVEAALSLEVTPHIASDGSISMKIKASNNAPGEPVTGSTIPPINKKEATTELQVQNGETTVIGGIYVDSIRETDTGVPFLMDIPLLGWLFKSNSKLKTKTELLIFITPKIVS